MLSTLGLVALGARKNLSPWSSFIPDKGPSARWVSAQGIIFIESIHIPKREYKSKLVHVRN